MTTNRPPLGASVRGFSAMVIWQYANGEIMAEIRRLECDPSVHPGFVQELRDTWLDVGAAGREYTEWRRQQAVAANGNRPRSSADVVSISDRLPLLDTSEVAERLQRKERRVRQLCESGQLKAVKRGGQWWVDPAELEIFIATRKGAA